MSMAELPAYARGCCLALVASLLACPVHVAAQTYDLDYLLEDESASGTEKSSTTDDATDSPSAPEADTGSDDTQGRSEPSLDESPAPYAQSLPVEPIVAEEAPRKAAVRKPQARLEEIIVTAQKRAEDVRDVPIAISVMSGEDMKKAAISSFDEMARLIPNVSFNTDFNSLYMRGIGTAELNIISEQAVSYVLDGVYVSRLDYLKPGFMDVQRIEVLKGPQGTLYGRNATAGVINVTYGEPTEEWESSVSISGGSRNLRKVEAAVSGPISDDLGFRLAGNLTREDGHTLNLTDGNTLGDKDIRQARAKFHYRITDDLDVSLGASYFDYFIGVWGGAETFRSAEPFRSAITLLDPNFEYQLDRRSTANRQNASNGEGIIVPLQFTLDYWNHSFSSITAYSRLDDFQGGDIDGSAAMIAEMPVYSKSHAISQEFRVVSPPGDIEYVGGVFLYQSEFSADLDIAVLPNFGLNTISGVGLLTPLIDLIGADTLDPLTDLVFPAGNIDNLNGEASVRVNSLGLFGQATWHISDSLALLLGGRYSKDDRRGKAVESSDGPVPFWAVVTLGGFSVDRKADDENFSPKVSLTWEMLDEVTLYGTYAKGFRAGSFNIAAIGGPDDFEFKGEDSTTYEAGFKTEFLGGLIRFNLGGFATVYKDYQLATFNGLGYSIANAEEVTSRGIESDLTAMIYPGLIATAAVGYNKGQFEKYTQGGCPSVGLLEPGGLPPQGIAALPPNKICDLSGRPLFRAPEWTGNLGLNYAAPLFDWSMDLVAGVNATYKGFEYMDSDLDPVDGQDAYWLYNAHLGLKDADDRWSVVVHGKNLTDELVKTFSGDIPIQPGSHWALTNPPRSFSMTLTVNF
ncbi:TonB-dependent receptor [Sinimarinibacterium sp. CAU 1509]|uniref:TonB-dependent receptor n=1 Tax=Sinimarinibacterium sp. CAU 1509 TaxID=2562283 RepID=UPI0010ACDEE0|nr:TonB-dependent receptor [Sinimarinibacterium sp. CAU 1509]TJY58387.1 TonB-dependent receptor [Sinimarinibacterium sp. CAU 1509]